MEFQEFCKAYKRICGHYYKDGNCENCPLNKLSPEDDVCENGWINKPEEAEKIISDWAKKHPIKTRKTEFMKLFPNCSICQDTYPSVDVFSLDYNLLGSGTPDNQWWDTEIEDSNNG